MPDMALVKFMSDLGALGLALLALGLLWIRNRDDKAHRDRTARLEADMEAVEKYWVEQKAAMHYSAQADNAILEKLARLDQRVEAVSTRVDSLANATVELKSDVRHFTERRERA